MAQTFDTTAWLLETLLVTIGLLAAIPVLKTLLGLALVFSTRLLGRGRGRWHDFGLSLLPKFLQGALSASLGLGVLLAPSLAAANEPAVRIDRVIEVPAEEAAAHSPTQRAAGERSLPAESSIPTAQTASYHVVAKGESLWAISHDLLVARGKGATNADIDRTWRSLWRANLEVVGADPSLIRPGQRLRIPVDLYD